MTLVPSLIATMVWNLPPVLAIRLRMRVYRLWQKRFCESQGCIQPLRSTSRSRRLSLPKTESASRFYTTLNDESGLVSEFFAKRSHFLTVRYDRETVAPILRLECKVGFSPICHGDALAVALTSWRAFQGP